MKNSAALGTTGISIDGALLSRCGEPKSGVDSVVVVVFFYPAFRVWIDDIILYSVFFFFSFFFFLEILFVGTTVRGVYVVFGDVLVHVHLVVYALPATPGNCRYLADRASRARVRAYQVRTGPRAFQDNDETHHNVE